MIKNFLTIIVLLMSTVLFSQQESKILEETNFPPEYFQVPSGIEGTSIAKIVSYTTGVNITYTNPYTNASQTSFAGVFDGDLDGTAAKFYCIDLRHNLALWTAGQPHTYTDEGSTPAQITYILNNYYPYKPYSYAGAASTKEKEASAIQAAIWYFSDGVNPSTITNSEIKTRAQQIIADANANAGSVIPVNTLLISPASQMLIEGNTASFQVSAFDVNGNALPNVTITLSSTDGTLSALTVVTNAMGVSPIVTLTQGTGLTASVTAAANVVIPHGTRYVHTIQPDTYQKLVLATPTHANLSVSATVEWYTPEVCDLNGFRTQTQGGWGSPNNSGPGVIRETYFSTVFPNGLTIGTGSNTATFTTSAAIREFLPAGGTAGTLSGALVDPLSTPAGVLAGQLVAATLNVYFDAAGYLGTNPQQLGRLIIVSGPFAGKTVYELLAVANTAISGGSVPYTLSEVNDALTGVNENFVDGTMNGGFLDCGAVFASIGNFVWNDVNKNGIQDNGETGVEGVTVNLYDCTDQFIASTTTDVNGYYSFGNLNPGSYYVQFILPANYAFTGKDEGTDDALDSDADITTGKTICTTLLPGEDDLTWDAGVYSSVPCATSWTGSLGADQQLCEDEPVTITVNGSVTLTPNPSRAVLQTWWRVVAPADLANGYNYTNTDINGDMSFDIQAQWPGIRYNDTYVEVEFGMTVLNCDGVALGQPLTKKVYWNPEVCPPPPPNEADVKIIKTADKSEVQNGENIVYTLLATNMGPKTATGVTVTDVLPSALQFVSASATVGTYDHNTGVWTIGTMESGANASLTITVNVNVTVNGTGYFDLGAAKGYNVFVLYDITQPSSDTEGKMAVGRNAQLANYSIGDKLPAYPYGQEDVLVVGNNLTFTSGAVYNGNVVYGNSSNLPIYPVSVTGGTVRKENVIDFTAAEAYLKSLSATLGAYTVNGTTTYQWGGVFLEGNNPVLNVFEVSGTQLSTANNFSVTVPNGSAVLVNIDGTTVSWSGGLGINGTSIQNVIYNFYEAENIQIQYIDVTGTILAPLAAVNFVSGVQNGQMICKYLEGQGQFNNKLFMGNVPVDVTVVNVGTIESTYPADPNLLNNTSQASVRVGGIEQTTSPAGNWEHQSSLAENKIITSLTFDQNANLLSGTVGGSIYRNTGADSWVMVNGGMNVDYIWALVTADNGNILSATEEGVYVSTNQGESWSLSELSGKEIRVLTKASDGSLYAGTWGYGVYKSVDNGNTWQIMNGGITSMNIRSITASANGALFAGTFDGGLFRSMNGGYDWVRMNVGYDYIYSLGISTSGIVYAGTYGGGLYRSTNNGDSWISSNTGISSKYIYQISTDASNNVFAGTWNGGVYVTKNNGASWQQAGMSGFEVSSMILDTDNSLIAGTGKGAIYKMTNGVTGTGEEEMIPTEFKLEQNYPNPFNPVTTIEFSVARSERVTLTIYNILGEAVKTLINSDYKPGRYTVQFNASDLASGVYIYNMRTNSTNFTKKMMLLK